MYTDKKRHFWQWVILSVLAVILVVILCGWFGLASDRTVSTESAAALKAAIQRCARQCYAVEGVYPTDIAYLEDHYGLQVNHTSFYISYDVYASNQPPDIRVIAREG